MTLAIDLQAEFAQYDRFRALGEVEIDKLLAERKLETAELFAALEALIGLQAGTLSAAPAHSFAPPNALPCGNDTGGGGGNDGARAETFEICGKVKFFDSLKRYGFIESQDGRGDVLLHISCLRAAGHATVHAGAFIRVLAFNGPRGMQATRVLSMDQSTAVDPAQLDQRTHTKVEPESDWVEVAVRWYNLPRGYGFVHEHEGAPDIFVHAETLRRWGVAALRPGQKVEVRWGTTARGRMVAEIRLVRTLPEAA
jgi:CspA family cold shock protein